MAIGETPCGEDPWAILGVDTDADETQIRAAYLQKVKDHPPDRDGETFERIRDAYRELSDPKRRAQRMLLAVDPALSLIEVLDAQGGSRAFVGPKPWLEAVRET